MAYTSSRIDAVTPMPFDRDLATELLHSSDRDVARFFAGRETEVRAFEAAIRSAGTKPRAQFRIFQGPPGCGKTSLAHHLAETCFDKLLFVPCVVMMTGLGHTSLRVADVRGLSRLASNAVIDMGAMEESECAASTAKMFDALNVSGERMERDAIARLTADLAHKWPLQLHYAQTALCEELIRTDGVLREVDTERLRARSDELRHAHYRSRLEDPILKIDSTVTQQILVAIATTRPPIKARWQLRRLCETVIDQAGLSGEPEFQELPQGAFPTALIENGIVSDAGGKWEVSIPSMVDWAANELPEFEGRKPSNQTPP